METYYDNDYSLTKLTVPEYVLDPRFEAMGCAVRFAGEDRSRFIDGPDLPAFFRSLDPASTTAVAFNAMFDLCLVAWRYDFVPARIVCTLRLAVALRGHLLQRHSLAEVGRGLGVGTKGTILESARGKRRADMVGDPEYWRAYQEYAINDNAINRAIFLKLMPEFPASERRIMDRVLRCAVVPRFVVDRNLLEGHLIDIRNEKARLLQEAGITDAGELRSTAKFEKLLREHGVEIQYKPSTTDPNRQIPAFSKTDKFMADLQCHEDPAVQALAAARLNVRSTIEETRTERLLSIANLEWPEWLGVQA
jgi:DNA polymerase